MRDEGKIYRSVSNRIILGVAGGVGDYFKIDPIIVRLIFVLLSLGGGSGVVIYLILGTILTVNTDEIDSKTVTEKKRRPAIGGVLVALGLIMLIEQLFPGWWRWDLLWSTAVIFFGFYLLLGKRN